MVSHSSTEEVVRSVKGPGRQTQVDGIVGESSNRILGADHTFDGIVTRAQSKHIEGIPVGESADDLMSLCDGTSTSSIAQDANRLGEVQISRSHTSESDPN